MHCVWRGVNFQSTLLIYVCVSIACSFCRESKKKCSGTAPCTQCLRRGMPQECHITYLPRGFRSRNKHNSITAGRQSWNRASQAPVNSSQDAMAATLPSPSNPAGTGLSNQVVGTSGHNGPLSPSESRDDNDDTRSYQTTGPAGSSRVDDTSMAENTSLTKLGPRMLLSNHGERGM